MPLSDKEEVLKRKKCCFICLKTGHRSKECQTNVRCLVCAKKHWADMCPEIPINQVKSGEDKPQKVEGKQNTALSNYCCAEEALLQTLQVYIETSGKRRKVRALIDTGSQRSYILKNTAKEMGYTPVGSESLIHTLFGGATSQREDHQCYNINLRSLTSDPGGARCVHLFVNCVLWREE